MGYTTAVTVIALILAAPAGAAIVHYVNPEPGEPGHYVWELDMFGPTAWLDITLSPEAQTNMPSPNAVAQLAGSFGNLHGPDPNSPGQHALVLGQLGTTIPFTIGLSHGDPLIGATWEFMANTAHIAGDGESNFPEGEHRYIGVLTMNGNYGWIEVIREGMSLHAIAWAYQTEPGVPIYAGQIPAPGAVWLLALCAVTAPRRRRISVGIEDAQDLIADLDRALDAV